jgi:hypothetical protein
MSGDVRLGPIREHGVGGAFRWSLGGDPGAPGSVALDAGYDLALTEYLDYATDVIVGHVVSVGVAWLR